MTMLTFTKQFRLAAKTEAEAVAEAGRIGNALLVELNPTHHRSIDVVATEFFLPNSTQTEAGYIAKVNCTLDV